MGTAPQEQFHFSGFSQLRKSQGAEHSPLPPQGPDISGASKPKSPLAVADGGEDAPPRPSWGGGAPTPPGICTNDDLEKGLTAEHGVTKVGPEATGGWCRVSVSTSNG